MGTTVPHGIFVVAVSILGTAYIMFFNNYLVFFA